ncbi:hypothetical protein [Caulobacter sp. LARHSG274]
MTKRDPHQPVRPWTARTESPPAPADIDAADLAGRDPESLTDAELEARYAAVNAARRRAFQLALLRNAETMLADINASLAGGKGGERGGGDWG